VDARLVGLVSGVVRGDTREVWKGLAESCARIERAQETGDTEAAKNDSLILRDLIDQGATTAETWRELYGAVELRRRLAATERRRVETMQVTITVEQALAWVGLLVASVKQHVTDRAALQAISRDIEMALRARPELARGAG
jgi:hypothetical protein